MSNSNKRCKNKNCTNPVLKGKYCEHCKLKRKDIGKKTGTAALGVIAVAGTIKTAISVFKHMLKP